MVVVVYGDGPLLEAETIRELVRRQESSEAAATLITTDLDDPTGYGRIISDSAGRLTAIVEQKAATEEQLAIREINSGIYCFRSGLLWEHLEKIGTDNLAGEYYLTDIVEIFRGAGHHVETFRMEDESGSPYVSRTTRAIANTSLPTSTGAARLICVTTKLCTLSRNSPRSVFKCTER